MTTTDLTTAPPEVVEFIRDHQQYLHILTHVIAPSPDDAATRRNTQDSTDELRKLFPHLDDTTLAAFLTYAAVGCTQAGQLAGCTDLIVMGATYAGVAEAMAWQLATPDGTEPDAAS